MGEKWVGASQAGAGCPRHPCGTPRYGRDEGHQRGRREECGREQVWGFGSAGGGVSEELEVYLGARGWEGRGVCGRGGCVRESWPVMVKYASRGGGMLGTCLRLGNPWTRGCEGKWMHWAPLKGRIAPGEPEPPPPPRSLSARAHGEQGRGWSIYGPRFLQTVIPHLFPPIEHHQTMAQVR